MATDFTASRVGDATAEWSTPGCLCGLVPRAVVEPSSRRYALHVVFHPFGSSGPKRHFNPGPGAFIWRRDNLARILSMLIWILMFVSMFAGFSLGVSVSRCSRGTSRFWFLEYLRAQRDADLLKRQLYEATQHQYDAMYRVPPSPVRALEESR